MRFARIPVSTVRNDTCVIDSEITITTDSGDVLDDDITLAADIYSSNPSMSVLSRHSIEWRSSTLSLPIQLHAPLAINRGRLHVYCDRSSAVYDSFEDIRKEKQELCVASMWSDVIDAADRSAELVERRYRPDSARALHLFENPAALGDTFRCVQAEDATYAIQPDMAQRL